MRNRIHLAVRGVVIIVTVIVMCLLLETVAITKNTLISVSIVISYVTVIGAAVTFLNFQKTPNLSITSLLAGFITISIRSSWTAISDFFSSETGIQLLTEYRFIHYVADIVFIVFILLLGLLFQFHDRLNMGMKPIYLACFFALVVLSSIIYHSSLDIMIRIFQGSFLLGAMVVIIAVVSICSLILIYRNKEGIAYFDRFRLGSSFPLFFSATLLIFLSRNGVRIWIPFTVLSVMGIVLLYLSVAVPKLRKIEIDHFQAYALAVAPCILILLPLSTVLVAESFLPTFFLIGMEGYILIHLGISALSGILVYMLYTYTQYTPRVEHNALMFILSCWSIVNIFQSVVRPFQSANGESMIPFIVGTILTTLMLIGMEFSDFVNSRKMAPKYWIATGMVVSLILCLVGVITETEIVMQLPYLLGEPIARSLLLRSTIPMIGLLSYNLLKNFERDRRIFSIESITLAILTLWLIPNLLKGMYSDWTFGWWMGEFILGFGLALAPAIISHQLVIALKSVEKSQERARLYSDLLMHDISNYHQMMLLGIDLADMDDISTDLRRKRIRRIGSIVKESKDLVQNLREIISLEEAEANESKKMEVIESLDQAMTNLNASREPNEQIVLTSKPDSKHYVLADEQLVNVFEIILLRIIRCTKGKQGSSFGINVALNESDGFCNIKFQSPGVSKLQDPDVCSLYDYIEQSSKSLIGLHLVNALVGRYGGNAEVLMESGDFDENRCEFRLSLPTATKVVERD